MGLRDQGKSSRDVRHLGLTKTIEDRPGNLSSVMWRTLLQVPVVVEFRLSPGLVACDVGQQRRRVSLRMARVPFVRLIVGSTGVPVTGHDPKVAQRQQRLPVRSSNCVAPR